MRSTSARFRAGLAFLVLYVLGGAWGLPVLDAVVYHSRDAGAPPGPHVEAYGGCGHADGCVLGIGTPPSRAALGHLPAGRLAPTVRPAAVVPPAPPPRAPLQQSQRTRAPPVRIS